jgi:hypothetical protein
MKSRSGALLRYKCLSLFLLASSVATSAQTMEDLAGPALIDRMIIENYERRQNIDELEVFAKRLRDSQRRFTDGRLYINLFHDSMTTRINWSFVPFRAAFATWKVKYPNSPTPYIVEANGRLLTALGENYSAFFGAEPPVDEKLDREEVERVRQFLIDNKDVARADPFWFTLMAKIAVVQRSDPGELLALVNEGLDRTPLDFDLVTMATERFSSKWGGDAEQLEAFASAMLKRFEPLDGPGVYARIYWQALSTHYKLALFKATHADWRKLKSAIKDLIDNYPTDGHRNGGALMACLAGDRSETRRLLQDRNFRTYASYWQDPDALAYCRNWSASARWRQHRR